MADDSYNSYDEPKVCNHYNYKLEGDEWSLREDSFRDKNLITTPGWIVKDMLDLLPDSVWNTETTFLIPCIKSGNFAIEVKNRLMKCKDAMERFPSKKARLDHIDSKQLFCIYWYTEEEFNKNLISGHIWGINGFLESLYSQSVNLMCTDDLNFDTFKDKTGKKQEKLLESIKEKFGTVKFDVVIGNPPYNNDLYIDFVEWGHQRANKYSLWITPAKWQAKGGDKNEKFRKDIVPYMKDIVYYPDEADVFGISLQGGISYYLADKSEHIIKNIKNISKHEQGFNSIINRSIGLGLSNFGNQIIDKINNFKPLKIYDNDRNKRYKYVVSKLIGGHGVHNVTVLCPPRLYDNEKVPFNESDAQNFKCRFSSDNIEDTRNFISYVYTKFVQTLVLCGLIANYVVNNETWRFVPDPGKFDHRFTDQELYKKYNLTDEEIHIIESVIKERK